MGGPRAGRGRNGSTTSLALPAGRCRLAGFGLSNRPCPCAGPFPGNRRRPRQRRWSWVGLPGARVPVGAPTAVSGSSGGQRPRARPPAGMPRMATRAPCAGAWAQRTLVQRPQARGEVDHEYLGSRCGRRGVCEAVPAAAGLAEPVSRRCRTWLRFPTPAPGPSPASAWGRGAGAERGRRKLLTFAGGRADDRLGVKLAGPSHQLL